MLPWSPNRLPAGEVQLSAKSPIHLGVAPAVQRISKFDIGAAWSASACRHDWISARAALSMLASRPLEGHKALSAVL